MSDVPVADPVPSADPTPTPSPEPDATPSTAPPSFSYPERRDDWVPPDKYRAAEAATNRLATEYTRLQTELAQERQRLAALVGATPKTPDQEDQDRYAEAFFALPRFAHLRGLTPELMDRLTALAERAGEYDAATTYQWDRLRDRTLHQVTQRVQDLLGLETMNPEMAEDIHDMFRRWARVQPDLDGFRRRYEAEDPTLIDEFLQRYTEHHLTPIRRSAAASLTRPAQARVPRSGPSQPVVTQKPKRDYAKMTHDEARQAAEDDAIAYLKEHGAMPETEPAGRW
jgi:hypothetical protein